MTMKLMTRAGLCAAILALEACAPTVLGGPPMDLSPDLIEGSHVDMIYMSSDWLQSEDDFAWTLSEEVREELAGCATGRRPLDMRVHIEDLRRADRFGVLLNGDGISTMTGVVEFTDPARGGEIVGRYFVEVGTSAGGRMGGLLGDRQMMVSEEFGRALCEQAFGWNPRRPGLHNATR